MILINRLFLFPKSLYNKNMNIFEKFIPLKKTSPASEVLTKDEKPKSDPLKILVFDEYQDGMMGHAVQRITNYGGNKYWPPAETETTMDASGLSQLVKEKGVDVLLVHMLSGGKEQLEREITKFRNDPEIKKQPIIILMQNIDKKEAVDEVAEKFADVIRIGGALDIKKFGENLYSVPQLLSYVEDNYAGFMQKNKIAFYQEYADKLMARSGETADTEKEIAILEDIFNKNNVKNVLDAGGGSGRIAIPLAEKDYAVTDVDASADLLNQLRAKNDKVKVIEGDVKKLPVEDEQFEAVTYNWHVFCEILGNKSKQQVLKEAFRVLNYNGVVVMDIPDREKGEGKKDGVYIDYPGGKAIYVGYVPSVEEMEKYLTEAGFSDIEVKKWETKKGFPKITFVAKKK